MASTPRLPERATPATQHDVTDFLVSEFAADAAGSLSPFGDMMFPLPLDQLRYTHPGPAARPHVLPLD